MSQQQLIYLYESARYQDKDIIDFYVKKFLEEHPNLEDPSSPAEKLSGKTLRNTVHAAIISFAEKEFLQGEEVEANTGDEKDSSPLEKINAIFNKRYESVAEYFNSNLQKLNQQWPRTLGTLAEQFANSLPNPFDCMVNEKTKTKIAVLKDQQLNERLADLEKNMRNNIKAQLTARSPIYETFHKIPQLKNSFDKEVNKQIKLGKTWEEANHAAMATTIDPIQRLNVSIIVAGNYRVYSNELKKLFKEVLGSVGNSL